MVGKPVIGRKYPGTDAVKDAYCASAGPGLDARHPGQGSCTPHGRIPVAGPAVAVDLPWGVHALPSGPVQRFSVPPQEPFPIMGQEYAYHVAGIGRCARITAPYIEV